MQYRLFRALGMCAMFFWGAVGYTLIEILWRGYSHWTMALTGGICFCVIYMNEVTFADAPLWKRCLVGSLAITIAELLVGFTVNILLGWMVWDYSEMFMNFLGQICLLYSLLWFLLCIPLSWLCRLLKKTVRLELTVERGHEKS